MDGISRTSGVGPTITLGGKAYTVSGRILRHYAEIEAEIIKLRGNPFDFVRQASESLKDSPEVLAIVINQAWDLARTWAYVSSEDLSEFLVSWRGVVFALWLSIREQSAGLEFDEVLTLFGDECEDRKRKDPASNFVEEVDAAITQGGGDDELGNSTGSPQSNPSDEANENKTS